MSTISSASLAGSLVEEILTVLLDRGELSKQEISDLWNLSDDQYAALKKRLEKHTLLEGGEKERAASEPNSSAARCRRRSLLTMFNFSKMIGKTQQSPDSRNCSVTTN